ncbi:MAG: hypothetical protein N2971_06230, partial [Chlorobi bacterium]|nr:hypothetical protein [Chlorobiota bacterium]
MKSDVLWSVRFSMVLVLASFAHAQTTRWEALGNGLYSPVPTIEAIVPVGNDVYVGGVFTRAGNVSASMIARWSWADRRWYDVGGSVNSNVQTLRLAVQGSDTLLFVGGSFERVGTAPCDRLAIWNLRTQQWECLTDSVRAAGWGGAVFDLYLDGERLYVGGTFRSINGIPMSGMAVYNLRTRTWQALGNFEERRDTVVRSGGISKVLKVDSSLYVIGFFTHVDGIPAQGMARYDVRTQRWDSVPGARFLVTDDVVAAPSAIVRVGDSLIVGGEFETLGEHGRIRALAVYNLRTHQWSELAGGVWRDTARSPVKYYAVFALHTDGKRLYVGGSFDTAGTIPARNLAVYDFASARWDTLESGTNGRVTAFGRDQSRLYVGGGFTTIGSNNLRVNYIAAWRLDTATVSVASTPSVESPPTVEQGVIRFFVDEATNVTLELYDLRGSRCAVLCEGWKAAGEHVVPIPA